jgi:hypothetical protein
MAINSSIIDNPIISITNQINQYKIVLMFYNEKVFVSGGHRYTLILTASCPPACTNTVLAAVYYE